MTEKGELTPEELKKKAYQIGLRLKSSGLDGETIYARLENKEFLRTWQRKLYGTF